MLKANNHKDVQKLKGILAEHNFPEAGDLEIEKNLSEPSQKVIEDENITEENNNYKETSETAFVSGKCYIQTKYQFAEDQSATVLENHVYKERKVIEVDDENEIENEIKYSDESSGSEYVPEDRGNQSEDQSEAKPRVEQSENEDQDVKKKRKRVRRCQVNELKWCDRMNQQKRESGKMETDSGIETVCFICNETIVYDGVIVTRGLETLINTSKERKDNHHLMLQGKSSLQMHRTCQKRYTAKSRGYFTNPNITSLPTKPLDHLISPKRKKVRESSRFDFVVNCLFCGLPANQVKIKKGVKKRVSMRMVTDSEFQKLIRRQNPNKLSS
ncbi:unnamed protein product [Psylliodes chrysocephalus]|uniref:Uncharacterized protein n=1 Tax=Psylliodes chrysocephalus TaxID=3402493 RepID=A0A9P0CJG5_9CUCU|nr:unnamed protein product [Psylliodes chrysocephala]